MYVRDESSLSRRCDGFIKNLRRLVGEVLVKRSEEMSMLDYEAVG